MPYKDQYKQSEYQRQRISDRRNILIGYMGGKYNKCGSTENLEFDHINPLEKQFFISRILSCRWEIIEKELEKCHLLCEGCHLDKTSIENAKPQIHGTRHSYEKYRCRCDPCRAVKSALNRKRIRS